MLQPYYYYFFFWDRFSQWPGGHWLARLALAGQRAPRILLLVSPALGLQVYVAVLDFFFFKMWVLGIYNSVPHVFKASVLLTEPSPQAQDCCGYFFIFMMHHGNGAIFKVPDSTLVWYIQLIHTHTHTILKIENKTTSKQTSSYYVVQVNLKSLILLLLPPECCYGHMPPSQARDQCRDKFLNLQRTPL